MPEWSGAVLATNVNPVITSRYLLSYNKAKPTLIPSFAQSSSVLLPSVLVSIDLALPFLQSIQGCIYHALHLSDSSMTQREASHRRSRDIHTPSQKPSSTLKRSSTHQDNALNLDKMVESKTIIHIIEILGVFACAHHFWPKGITYGEQEEWEKAHRKRHEHGSKSRSKGGHRNGSGSSSSDGRRKSSREEKYEYDDDERPRYSRHASPRY